MASPVFGIDFERLSVEPLSVVASDMSVVGLIGTAPGADVAKFPLNTAIQVFSNDTVALAALGLTGTIVDAIPLINAQLGDLQSAAKIIVVRVTDGGTDDLTITNIIGSQASNSGIWAFPTAGPLYGIIPRLIIAPGYTWQVKIGLATPTIVSPGTGGTAGTFALAFVGGTGSGATGTFTVVGGAVTQVTLTNPGVYSVAPTISLTASAGLTGASVTTAITTLANPVCAALPPVLTQLLAVAIVEGPSTTIAAWTAWRNTLSSDRTIPVETSVKVGVNATQKPSASCIAGIGVRRDYEFGGVPSRSWANQSIFGIVGPARPIPFSLTDGASEGQQIISQQGGVILRGEAGVETSIASGGYVYVGTDNTSTDVTWQQYHQIRMRDFIHLGYLKTLKAFLGKFNITGQTVQAIVNTMKGFMRDLQAGGHILGFDVTVPSSLNSPEQLRLGKLQILFKCEEAPVLKTIHIQSARYRPALVNMVANIQAQLDQTI